jgi:hypothetical protein
MVRLRGSLGVVVGGIWKTYTHDKTGWGKEEKK